MKTADTPAGFAGLSPRALVRDTEPLTPAKLGIQWLDWLLRIKGRSKRTIDSYAVIVRQWLEWCDGHSVAGLAPELDDLERFVVRPRQRQAHGELGAASTRRADVIVLRSWFGWLHQRGHLPKNPTTDLEAPSVKPGQPKPVPDHDWLVLWGAVELGSNLHIGLGLGYFCGLRRRECSKLVGDQITEEAIVSFERKGGGDDTLPWRSMLAVYNEKLPQLAPKSNEWADYLVAAGRAAGESRLLWSEGQQFYKSMLALCRRAGLERSYTPHMLRHSAATNLLRAGVPPHLVMSLMNHTSFDMTRRYMKAGGTELDEWRRTALRTP